METLAPVDNNTRMAQVDPSLFAAHSRLWRDNHFVYPVISRRSRGLSIGINLNPDKACNFDCVYCCVDRTVPPAVRTVDLAVVESELSALLALVGTGAIWQQPPFDRAGASQRRLNDVAFSGDGEPTSYARFDEACRLVVRQLAGHALADVKIVTISNATLLHRPKIVAALEYLDEHNGELWAKLDAGTEGYYRRIDRTRVPLARVLGNIRDAGRVRALVIQSLFVQLDGLAPDDAEIDAYVRRLEELRQGGCRIARVQVYTSARRPADPRVAPLPRRRIQRVAGRVRACGFATECFSAAG